MKIQSKENTKVHLGKGIGFLELLTRSRMTQRKKKAHTTIGDNSKAIPKALVSSRYSPAKFSPPEIIYCFCSLGVSLVSPIQLSFPNEKVCLLLGSHRKECSLVLRELMQNTLSLRGLGSL